MESFMQDLRYAVRTLSRKPGFTAVAIIALGLGIGANTAIFSAVNAVLLNSLPYDNPDQLLWVWENNLQSDIDREPASFPNFIDWKSQAESVEDMAAFSAWLPVLTNEGEPERLSGGLVTASLFPVLRVQPILGRAFLTQEEQQGNNRVVILSHNLWRRRFGMSPEIIGKAITLNGNPFTVVGVMPPTFEYPTPEDRNTAEIWTPLALNLDQAERRQDFLSVIARLKPSVFVEQARAELQSIASRLEQQYPETNAGWSVTVIPLHERFVGDVRTAMLLLLVAVGFLLLIACANVANLLLVRATARQKEVAIRRALGAARGRLIRLFLTESLLLAVMGGIVGALLAFLGIRLLIAFSPGNIPRIDQAGLDTRMLGFTLAVSLLTGAIFGLFPALQASKVNFGESLKEGGRGSTEGAGGRRLRSLLAVFEISLALLLLVGAGLMFKSFLLLQRVDPGFSFERILTFELQFPRSRYKQQHQIISFMKEVTNRVEALPAIESVAAVSTVPLTGQVPILDFFIEGRPPLPPGQVNDAQSQVVSASYFSTLGIPLLRGRFFDEQDTDTAVRVAIINDVMAERYWPGEDPIGKRIRTDEAESDEWLTIVGIVGGVKHVGLELPPYSQMYEAYTQNPRWATALMVRTASDPMLLASAIRDQVRAVDKDQPLYNVRTIREVLSESVARPRFNTQLISLLTAVALILTAVGIYGVISYSVTQRFHEIGIRMALGAQRSSIIQMILGHGLKLALIGIIIGLAAAFSLTRLMKSLLFGVSTTDPFVFVLVPAVIALVVLAACYLPARKATKVDPVTALRVQ